VSEATPLLRGDDAESIPEDGAAAQWKKPRGFLLVEIGKFHPGAYPRVLGALIMDWAECV